MLIFIPTTLIKITFICNIAVKTFRRYNCTTASRWASNILIYKIYEFFFLGLNLNFILFCLFLILGLQYESAVDCCGVFPVRRSVLRPVALRTLYLPQKVSSSLIFQSVSHNIDTEMRNLPDKHATVHMTSSHCLILTTNPVSSLLPRLHIHCRREICGLDKITCYLNSVWVSTSNLGV